MFFFFFENIFIFKICFSWICLNGKKNSVNAESNMLFVYQMVVCTICYYKFAFRFKVWLETEFFIRLFLNHVIWNNEVMHVVEKRKNKLHSTNNLNCFSIKKFKSMTLFKKVFFSNSMWLFLLVKHGQCLHSCQCVSMFFGLYKNASFMAII